MMKTLIKGYIFRLLPAIIGLGGALFEIPEVFYVGGIICLAIHIILFFRASLKPVLFIIGIYLGAFLLLLNFTGILWGAIISTIFELIYHGIKTNLAIQKIKRIEGNQDKNDLTVFNTMNHGIKSNVSIQEIKNIKDQSLAVKKIEEKTIDIKNTEVKFEDVKRIVNKTIDAKRILEESIDPNATELELYRKLRSKNDE